MSGKPLTPSAGWPGSRWEIVLLAAAFVLVNMATAVVQKPFPFHGREGWEGSNYLSMARQAAADSFPITEEAPTVYRLGAPMLAGWAQRFTGWDLIVCFRLVNGTANILTLALLVVWLRLFLEDWRVRVMLVLVFLLQWDAPVRWMYFFPPHTDPWMWTFVLAGLIAVERCRTRPTPGRIALVTALTVVGVCFREIVLVLGLVLPFAGNPIHPGTLRERWRGLWPRFVPLVAGLLAMAALRLAVRRVGAYGFAWTALHYLFTKPWPAYVLSWFSAFGPILWLAVLSARRGAAFLAGRQHLAVYLAAFAALAYMGGSDTERFLYWTMPVVYVLIGRALEDTADPWPRGLLAGLTVLQLVAARAVFWPAIPPYPNLVPRALPILTPFGSDVPFDDLYTDTAPHLQTLVLLVEYLTLGAALGVWLLWRKGYRSTATPRKISA